MITKRNDVRHCFKKNKKIRMNVQVDVSNNDGRNPTFVVGPNVALLLCGRNKINGVAFDFIYFNFN